MTETEDEGVEESKMTIDRLASFDDAKLMDILGLTHQLEEFKEALKGLQALTGKAREYAEDQVADRFEPNIYPGDFKYIIDSAKRKASGKEEMASTEPSCL